MLFVCVCIKQRKAKRVKKRTGLNPLFQQEAAGSCICRHVALFQNKLDFSVIFLMSSTHHIADGLHLKVRVCSCRLTVPSLGQALAL